MGEHLRGQCDEVALVVALDRFDQRRSAGRELGAKRTHRVAASSTWLGQRPINARCQRVFFSITAAADGVYACLYRLQHQELVGAPARSRHSRRPEARIAG